MQAFIDGKLEPSRANLHDVLAACEAIDGMISELRNISRATGPDPRENLFNLVVEAAPNAMILVDQGGHITLVNAQTERLFGYRRGELLEHSIEMLVPERFRGGHPSLRNFFNQVPVARPMGAARDLYGRRKDGSEIPIEIALNPLRTKQGAFVLAAIVDITERKRAEELRLLHAGAQRHADELEELNLELESASRFKTQFVATMSHELRTPLSAIIGAAELLAKSPLDERAQISVQTIAEGAEALFSLVNNILDFSKIEAGKVELDIAPFLLETLFEGSADVSAQLAREKDVTVHTYVDPTIPPVEGDADRLRQILLNLLGNAVKFTKEGHVIARALPQETNERELVVRFEVEDTGIGIDPELVPRLFEPFVQADRSGSRRFSGTGLGLSISKRLVELMGGEIGVSSRPGSGSLFWFTARFKRALAPAVPARLLNGIVGLIVSRDDVFAQIIQRYVESWHMASRRAASHVELITMLQSRADGDWIVIVDLDDTGDPEMVLAVDVLRATAPERVVAVGGGGPVRQSFLFDAIVKGLGVGKPPVRPGTPEPAAPQKAAIGAPVLVAENSSRLQRLLQLQFDDLGVAAHFVSDGREAIDAVRNRRYSMVFIDCQMPNVDGLSAIRTIRAEEAGTARHLPVVAMTANAFAEDRDACIAAGMDDYLAKPLKLADLRAMVDRWAGNPAQG